MAAGRTVPETHNLQKWPVQDVFPVLGHRLDNRGSAWPCWEATKRSMWGAFYKTCGSQTCTRLPIKMKMRTLKRCVLPVCEFRCTRWPYHETLAEDVNRVQRKMTAILCKVPRVPGELDEEYFRRRHRHVGHMCRAEGLWAHRWAKRVVEWEKHLKRPRNEHSWAAKLLEWRGKEWLASRRQRFAVGTCTRINPGAPCPRWHESVSIAQAALDRLT